MEHWLSLKVLDSSLSEPAPRTPKVYISIPKKTVKLAVARNRLKRVLREAIRLDPFFVTDKTYRLRVNGSPKTVNLGSAQKTLKALHG